MGGGESVFLMSRRRIDGTQLILCPACMFGRLAGPGLHLHPPEGPSRGEEGVPVRQDLMLGSPAKVGNHTARVRRAGKRVFRLAFVT